MIRRMNTPPATRPIDLRMWYLPDWLYEAWPFIHLLGGAGIVVTFDSTIGSSSGLLLVMAGIAILVVRGWHRSARARNPAARPEVPRRVVAHARSYYNDPSG